MASDEGSVTRRGFLQAAGSALALGALEIAKPAASQFIVKMDAGAIVSLKRAGDAFDTDYIQAGRRLGDAIVKYRRGSGAWETLDTSAFTNLFVSPANDGARHAASYRLADAGLELRVEFNPAAHASRLRLSGGANGRYSVRVAGEIVRPASESGFETSFDVPVTGGSAAVRIGFA
jgi:hypothetical protein